MNVAALPCSANQDAGHISAHTHTHVSRMLHKSSSWHECSNSRDGGISLLLMVTSTVNGLLPLLCVSSFHEQWKCFLQTWVTSRPIHTLVVLPPVEALTISYSGSNTGDSQLVAAWGSAFSPRIKPLTVRSINDHTGHKLRWPSLYTTKMKHIGLFITEIPPLMKSITSSFLWYFHNIVNERTILYYYRSITLEFGAWDLRPFLF